MPESTNELTATTISAYFCPEVIEENGYHYYTCFQFAQLEMILTLRKWPESIERVRICLQSIDRFFPDMEQRKLWIEDPFSSFI